MKILNELPTSKLKAGTHVAIDIEMFGQDVNKLHRPHGTLACVSFATDEGVYQFYDKDDVADALKYFGPGQWIFQNGVYDLRQLRALGFKIAQRPIFDTLLVEHNIYGGYYSSFGLDDMARRYLNIIVDKQVRTEFGTATKMTAAQKKYAANDAVITLKVARAQMATWTKEIEAHYWLIDAPMVWVVLDLKPVKVDVDAWRRGVEGFAKQAQERQDKLGFNVMSHQQVKAAVAKQCRITLKDTSKTTLEKYAEKYPLIQEIIDVRTLRKAVSTYGETWLQKAIEDDCFVWANWNITGAETGRMSCSSPNLQNIPARNVRMGMDIYRTFFVSDGGSLIISDVAQQEPRITASVTQDAALIKTLRTDDPHGAVARDIFEKKDISKEERNIGKQVNLGMSYGMSPFGLMKAVPGMSEERATEIVEQYFEKFPGVYDWIQANRRRAQIDEYVTTPAGRRIWLNLYNEQWPNNAINAPIQGGAADHTKLTLSTLHRRCQEDGVEFPVSMVIHDEIVADAPTGTVKMYKRMVRDAWLESAGILYPSIPFEVDIHTGPNWGAKG